MVERARSYMAGMARPWTAHLILVPPVRRDEVGCADHDADTRLVEGEDGLAVVRAELHRQPWYMPQHIVARL